MMYGVLIFNPSSPSFSGPNAHGICLSSHHRDFKLTNMFNITAEFSDFLPFESFIMIEKFNAITIMFEKKKTI